MLLHINTTIILEQLRLLMLTLEVVQEPLAAYIVPSGDAHRSLRMAECDQRRAFVSGFDGSAGTAIVTQEAALLWTDARYFIQAEAQLDQNWTLMKDGISETQSEWLIGTFPPGSRIGLDPRFYSKLDWDDLEGKLGTAGLGLVPLETNLVDMVWVGRPTCPLDSVTVHELKYAGIAVGEKVKNVRDKMAAAGAEVLFISELDEVAWLLNLRGSDLPLAPVFNAYVILTPSAVEIFIDSIKMDESIQAGLVSELVDVSFWPYGNVLERVLYYASTAPGKIWISKYCNALFANSIRPEALIMALTPISLMKAVKNPVEAEGMKAAHLRDSIALVRFLSWLEGAINAGDRLSEISVADKLANFREEHELHVGRSFPTISASGPNGAIVHYFPTPQTERLLSTDEMFLLDSGSHYLDGTTDITRTVHFGTPSTHQKDAFTRVLKGHIAIAQAVFPSRTPGHSLDSLARRALWEAGMDYGHGTSHGIGAYLHVGEGPQSIASKPNPDDPGLQENMFLSNEPGYYEEGEFGIRLENIVRVIPSPSLPGFLQMETISFVPIQKTLIEPELLGDEEVLWVNTYHERCLALVGPFLDSTTLEWLTEQTSPLNL